MSAEIDRLHFMDAIVTSLTLRRFSARAFG
jgi:hypothetical protein